MLDRPPRLRSLLERPAGRLSGGEQHVLALARGQLARSALLDEPSPELAPAVAQALVEALSRLRDEGLTFLVDLALPSADSCAVLSGGSIGHVAAALDDPGPETA